MQAYRLKTTVPESSALQLNFLTLEPGEPVEIIVLALAEPTEKMVIEATSEMTSATALPVTGPQWAQQQAALATIQEGKYAYSVKSSQPLPSEAFAARKAEEKAREESKWS